MSKSELTFCVTGISIGILIGYYIGINWGYVSHHMHHMKAIVCHHYIGIEVLHIIKLVCMKKSTYFKTFIVILIHLSLIIIIYIRTKGNS